MKYLVYFFYALVLFINRIDYLNAHNEWHTNTGSQTDNINIASKWNLQNYAHNPIPLRLDWSINFPPPYSIGLTYDDVDNAIFSACNEWSSGWDKIQFTYVTSGGVDIKFWHHSNIFSDNGAAKTVFAIENNFHVPYSSNSQTNSDYTAIYLNASTPFCSPNRRWTVSSSPTNEEIDFQGVILHELGHVIGLSECTDGLAAMYPGIYQGTTRRLINSSDRTGIKNLYIASSISSGTPLTVSAMPRYFKFNKNMSSWSVIGIRPQSSSFDPDLALYCEDWSSPLTYSEENAGLVDYIVLSNTATNGIYYGNTYEPNPNTIWENYTFEWEAGYDVLQPSFPVDIWWNSDNIVKIWDVFLTANQTRAFTLNVSSGNANLGMALYRPNWMNYNNRQDYVCMSDDHGYGGNESFTFTPDYTGNYGLLVWSNNTCSGTTFASLGFNSTTDIQDENNLPKKFAMHQNYPNPFNPSTTIKYDLPKESKVKLKVYNLLGQEVVTLVNGMEQAGYKSVTWNGKNKSGHMVGSGLYIYRLEAGGNVFSKKMLFMK